MALAAIGAVLAFAIICIALGWHRLAGRRAGRDLVPSEDKGEHLQLTSHEENGEHQQLTKAAGTSIVPAAGPPARLRVVLDVQAVACEFIVEVDPTALESIVSVPPRVHSSCVCRVAGVLISAPTWFSRETGMLCSLNASFCVLSAGCAPRSAVHCRIQRARDGGGP
eukprot:7315659-Prymnesium_polylepis.1